MSSNNFYIKKWVTVKSTYNKKDSGMIGALVSKTQTKNIEIIGGAVRAKTASLFDIEQSKVTEFNNGLSNNTFTRCQSYAILNNAIYFTNMDEQQVFYFNFYRFNLTTNDNINNDKVDSIGLKHPKPTATMQECYTSDELNGLLYLIGGINTLGDPIDSFSVFNINTNLWNNLPSMRHYLYDTACFYYNGRVFVFGGMYGPLINQQPQDTIFMFDVANNAQKWIELDSKLTQPAASIFAFVVDPYSKYDKLQTSTSNTAYIMGQSLCNRFTLDTFQITQCKSYENDGFGNFAAIYVGEQYNRFYIVGGAITYGQNQVVWTNAIKYAQFETSCSTLVDLSESVTTIAISNNYNQTRRTPIFVPIVFKTGSNNTFNDNNDTDCDYLIRLNSTWFDFGSDQIINYTNSKCYICNINNIDDCWSCDQGIEIKAIKQMNIIYDKINENNIFHVTGYPTKNDTNYKLDIIGFNITVWDFINISYQNDENSPFVDIGHFIPIHISTFMLLYTTNQHNEMNYRIFEIYSNNSIIAFDKYLNIGYNDLQIIECYVCNNRSFSNHDECFNCSQGILLPLITNESYVYNNFNYHINILKVQGYTQSNASFLGFEVGISDFIDLSKSYTMIDLNQSIPIIISNFLLKSNGIYNLQLISNDEGLILFKNTLEIQLNNTQIKDCKIITNNIDNCNEGILPYINCQSCVYNQENRRNMFEITAITKHTTSNNNVTINPFNVTVMDYVNASKTSASVSILQFIPIQFESFILSDNANYSLQLLSENNILRINRNLLMIETKTEEIQQCKVCDNSQDSKCNDCSQGILTQIATQCIYNKIDQQNKFQIIGQSDSSQVKQPNITFIGFSIVINDFVNFTLSKTSIIPGSFIPIKISSVTLKQNSNYYFRLLQINKPLTVNNIIHITTNNTNISKCKILSANGDNSTAKDCNQGISPQIDYNYVNDNNNIVHIPIVPINNSNITVIPSDGISIEILLCKPGYGIQSKTTADCVRCYDNSFTLTEGVSPCKNCPPHLDGIDCKGGDIVMVTHNYWISSLNKTNNKLYPFYNITQNDSMFSALCPPGFCCNSVTDCDYLMEYNSSSTYGRLCAMNRNLSTYLCAKCNDGYSEMVGINGCGKCDETNYLLLIGIFFLFVFPFSIYLIYFDSKPSDKRQKNEIMKSIDNQIECIKMLIFQIGTYYFQSLSAILSTRGITSSTWMESIIIGLFNFQIGAVSHDNDNNSGGFCVFAAMTALGKLLTNFMIFGFIAISFLFIGITNYFNLNPSHYVFCCFVWKKYFDRIAYIKIAIIRISFMFIGAILNTAFKMITCTNLGNGETVHFYDPYMECFGYLWYLALFLIIFILFIFIGLFYILSGQTNELRTKGSLQKMVKSFKTNCWYWESALFLRRILIAIFCAFQYIAAQYVNVGFCIIFGLFIIIHVHKKPFLFKEANYFELLCLFCLQSIFVCINALNMNNNQFLDIYIAISVIIPCLIMIYYMIRIIWFYYLKYYKNNEKFKENQGNVQQSTESNETTENLNVLLLSPDKQKINQ